MLAATSTTDLGGVAGWVVDVIESIGSLGVGGLILLETVFPPLPSEIVLAFAGFSVSQGVLNGPLAWAAATAGSLAGAYVLYAVGALVGYDRLHDLAGRRWFILFTQTDLRRGERFFARHGSKVVLLARVVPLLRSIVSVPAGITRMPLPRFSALTVLGSGVWNALFLYAGYRLGVRWDEVGQYLRPVSYAVVASLLLALIVLTARTLRRRLVPT